MWDYRCENRTKIISKNTFWYYTNELECPQSKYCFGEKSIERYDLCYIRIPDNLTHNLTNIKIISNINDYILLNATLISIGEKQ